MTVIADDRGPQPMLVTTTVDKLGHLAPLGGEPVRLRMLLSYWYYKDRDLRALLARFFTEPYPRIFADSGAYSAYTQGARIDLGAYAEWLHRYADLFGTYANLDDLADWRRTARNQADLEGRGLAPLPVFHVGEPIGVLEDLVASYPYVGLGGLVGHGTRTVTQSFYVRAFRLAASRAVYHGFGVTNWPTLRDFPWYSVDSSTWLAGLRYGALPIMDLQRRALHQVRHDRSHGRRAAAQFLARHGRSLAACLGPGGTRWKDGNALSALAFREAEEWLRRRHGPVGVPGRPERPAGLLLYLGASSFHDLVTASHLSVVAGAS